MIYISLWHCKKIPCSCSKSRKSCTKFLNIWELDSLSCWFSIWNWLRKILPVKDPNSRTHKYLLLFYNVIFITTEHIWLQKVLLILRILTKPPSLGLPNHIKPKLWVNYFLFWNYQHNILEILLTKKIVRKGCLG